MAKPALGRGLSALLGGAPAPATDTTTTVASAARDQTVPLDAEGATVLRLPLDQIRPCSLQPRKDFSAESLNELADSIREQGIVQPLIVRRQAGNFELIAGERRWRAAQLAGLTAIPAILREADDRTVLEMALIENLQRENLNPIEEALGYAQLVSQFQLTQEEVSAKVGKSRAAVANAVRLLKLPPLIQGYVRDGRLSVGHAKVILGLNDEKLQRLISEKVIKEALNVRQTEGLVAKSQSRHSANGKSASARAPSKDANLSSLEDRLRERLGTKVHLRYKQGKGSLDIIFYSDDELERILDILGVQP